MSTKSETSCAASPCASVLWVLDDRGPSATAAISMNKEYCIEIEHNETARKPLDGEIKREISLDAARASHVE